MFELPELLKSWQTKWTSIADSVLAHSSVEVRRDYGATLENAIKSLLIRSPIYKLSSFILFDLCEDELKGKLIDLFSTGFASMIYNKELINQNNYTDWLKSEIILTDDIAFNFYGSVGKLYFIEVVIPPNNEHVEKNMPRYDNYIRLIVNKYIKYHVPILDILVDMEQKYGKSAEIWNKAVSSAFNQLMQESGRVDDHTKSDEQF